MKKPKIVIDVLKENEGYSAQSHVQNLSIFTEGENFEELKTNVLDAVNLSFEEKGFVYTIDEITFNFDLESFFQYYKIINASALSKRIKMPQSLLSQYINGMKKPSPRQTQRILQGVQQVGKELAEINFVI